MSQSIIFHKLTPTNDVDLKVYEDAFNYIFVNDDIRNVAISGPYSAGKSSILESYKRTDDRTYIHISLAHFKDYAEEKHQEENVINENKGKDIRVQSVLEGKIINQLIQQINANNIPQTNFRVKKDISKGDAILSTVIAVSFIISLVGMIYFQNIMDWISLLPSTEFSIFVSFIISPYLRPAFALICIIIGAYYIYKICITQRLKNIIRKLSLQGNEIEVFNENNDSFFDKYLNEILYLFENSNVDVVVFEDIDRFEIGTTFERLREINYLANIRLKNKNKTIRFFYLLRDDIFMNKDRTKFFDFILPVIPVVDSSNAFDKFKGYLEESNIYKLFDESFLRGLSLYVDDLRVLKNIYNEFMIYYNKLNIIDLEIDKMLAIITYKNIFPKDFSELQLGKGFVYTLFEHKKDFVKSEKQKIDEEINIYEQRIENCQSEHLESVKELDTLYNPKISELRRYQYRNNELKELEDEKSKRKQAVEDKINNRIEEAKENIICLKNKKEVLEEKALKDIITRENIDSIFKITITDELGELIDFNDVKGNDYFDLLKFLLRYGYIDESYCDYMSFFYENSLTGNDKKFLRGIMDQKAKKYDYFLDNVSLVILNLEKKHFKQLEILNFIVFHEILKEEGYKEYLNTFVSWLSTNNYFDFIYQYLEWTDDKKIFINKVCTRWNNLFFDVLKKANYSDKQLHDLCVMFVSFLDNSVLEKINIDNCLSNYIANDKNFLSIIEPNIEKVTESLISLNVKFCGFDEGESNKELLDAIYKSNLYLLNIDNIYLFIKLYYSFAIGKDNSDNILSIIRSQNESLCSYVNNNIEEVINLLLDMQNDFKDDEDTILYILNNSEITIESKERYIERMEAIVSSIKLVQEQNLQKTLVSKSKIKYSLENIVSYYVIGGIGAELIAFINNTEEKIKGGNVEEESLTNFWKAFLPCEDVEDIKYQEILKAIKIRCKSLAIKDLSDSKMEILINEKIIIMNESNVIFIRNNYPNHIVNFIRVNCEQYIELAKKDEIIPIEIEHMIDWDISNDDIIMLLQKNPTLKISIANKKIDDVIGEFIILNHFDASDKTYLFEHYSEYGENVKSCIEQMAYVSENDVICNMDTLDMNLVEKFMNNQDIPNKTKETVLVAGMDRMNKQKCKQYLELLSHNELAKIFIQNGKPQIAVNSTNKKMLLAMKHANFILDFTEDTEASVYKIIKPKKKVIYVKKPN